MTHGWLDGRRGIPQLPEDPGQPINGTSNPAAESHLTLLADLPAEPISASQPPRLSTPRIGVLTKQALVLIEEEKIRFCDEWAVLMRQYAGFLESRDALTRAAAVAEYKVGQARSPLSGHERDARRLAEQDSDKWPDGLVRARRQTGWEQRLGAAEQQHQSVTARLAEATHEAELREALIRDRAAVARAAARSHHELAQRRIATYLQQLVRSHRRGADLNRLLTEYPVGPDLPEWTRDPAAGQSGIELMVAEGGASAINDPHPRNEASGS